MLNVLYSSWSMCHVYLWDINHTSIITQSSMLSKTLDVNLFPPLRMCYGYVGSWFLRNSWIGLTTTMTRWDINGFLLILDTTWGYEGSVFSSIALSSVFCIIGCDNFFLLMEQFIRNVESCLQVYSDENHCCLIIYLFLAIKLSHDFTWWNGWNHNGRKLGIV